MFRLLVLCSCFPLQLTALPESLILDITYLRLSLAVYCFSLILLNYEVYFFKGIPEQVLAPVAAQEPTGGQAINPPSQAPQATVPPGGPNADPLNLFPQVAIC